MNLYNLIVTYVEGNWSGTKPDFPRDRLFEATSQDLRQRFEKFDERIQSELMAVPTVFTEEISRHDVPMARIGWITNLAANGQNIRIDYRLPSSVPPIPADRLARALGIDPFPRGIGEMQRNHWAVKEGDLFTTLFKAGLLETANPSLFRIPVDGVRADLVSVMMPFGAQFNDVYQALKTTCENMGLECTRADNIWEDSTVIQDIFSLIFRSKVIICDFSEKNPNVFYEAGLAHALGRHVVPIVQHASDIPFDLRHHRYITYLNNAEGHQRLIDSLAPRIETLMRQ